MVFSRLQRAVGVIITVCFVVVFVGSAALIPRQAQAQGVMGTVEGPGPLLATIVQEPVRLSVWQSIWASAIVGVVSAVTLFAQQMAYDLAIGLASGCKGENPCAFTSDPGTYFTQLGYDAAGEFLGSLSGPWEELGLNLCNPRIPDVGLAISLGIAYGFQRPTPRCDFARTLNNWDQVAREASDPHALLKHASLSFDIGQSDISQAFQAQEAFKIQYERRLKAAEIKRLEGGGILPKEGLIGGHVDTPAEVMAENFRGLARTGEKSRQPPDSGELLGAVGGGDVWLAAGRTVLSTFFNTLVSRIIQSTLSGLFEPARETLPNLIELVTGGAERVAGGVGRLSRVARGLLTPTIRTSTDEFEYVSELAACPAQGKSEWNCTIDRQFQIAIQRAQTGEPLTVEQAIAARLLDGAKPFGFVNPQKGIEPTVSEGYPYSSMKKLRLLRVIPVGWEFAALKIENGGVTYTLREVVDGWNETGTDGQCGTFDSEESPFCGLVDPNWILKAPAAVCAARAFGERLDASGTGRQEACVDLKHCVAVDESGNCRAQGYCTREQNIWRFDGDACPEQFASCDVFTRAGGRGAAAQLAVLENTVDFGVCNADNAGCAAYATRRAGAGGDWSTGVGAPRMYFDGNAQQCNAAASGCTELTSVQGVRANLIPNSGFEQDEDGDGLPDGWNRDEEGGWSSDGTQSFEGRGALLNEHTERDVPVEENNTYTLSFWSKNEGGARVEFTFHPMRGAPISLGAISTTCERSGTTTLILRSQATGSSYTRSSCTFITPPGSERIALSIERGGGGNAVWFDAFQLEEGTAPTDYHDGYAYVGTPQNVYYRLPPEYLGCTGEEGKPAACDADYSWICRAAEVGCERYTPRGGDPAIPGIATALDRCPPGCAGYDGYIKQESRFEPRFTGENPYLLIAQNAAQCGAQEAGCDEFTNLRTEAREYFTDLRACQLPGPTSKTYFTWEGSETSGYQIKAWNLKHSNAGAIGGVDEINRADSATPPCTNYAIAVGAEGRITVDCTDSGTPSNQATCDPNDDSATLAERADCRGFYDEHGNIFYRKLSFTILSTPECQNYRWTGLPQAPNVQPTSRETADELRINLEQEACNGAHGFWNSECIFTGAPSASNSCRAAVSGCRGYKGSGGANVRQVISDDMESQEGWSAHIATIRGIIETPIELSGESLQPGRHSLKVPGASYALRSIPRINSAEPALIQGATYFVRAVVKGTAGSRVQVLVYSPNLLGSRGSFEALPIFDTIDLTPEWKYIELGPLVLDSIPQDTLSLMFLVNRGTATAGQIVFFIDDLVLREVRDTVYLVKDSLPLSVPASCDFLPAEAGGGYSPGAMLGCREYRDRANEPQHLTGFSSLCRDRSVGCQEFIDTRGTLSPYEETFTVPNSGVCRGASGQPCALGVDLNGNGYQPTLNYSAGGDSVCTIAAGATSCEYDIAAPVDDVVVPADTRRYVVTDTVSLKTCRAEEKGCSEVGRIDAAGNVTPAYLRNDPTRYGSDLCAIEAVGCAAWNRSGGSQAYFKDPLQSGGACEWRENVRIGSQTYSGWFKKDKVALTALVPRIYSNTPERCQGYGRWNASTTPATCVGPDGRTICRDGQRVQDGGIAVGEGDNALCTERYCTQGVGGTWDAEFTHPDGTHGVCRTTAPCYGAVNVAATIHPIIEISQTTTYLTGGSTFGIWRNGDSSYGGRVGMCPQQEATCSEFVDPTDTSDSPRGKAYYRKDNERLVQARKDCEVGVSRQQGCVLFDNTEDPRKIYSTSLTYAASEAAGGSAVVAESDPSRQFYCIGGAHDDRPCHGLFTVEGGVSSSACTAGGGRCGRRNDTNVILKVARDRECKEWLQCSRAQFVWSEQDQKMVTRCLGIGRCGEIPLPAAAGGPALEQCGRWITQPEPSFCHGGTHDTRRCVNSIYGDNQITPAECLQAGGRCVSQPLTDEHYQTRNRTFFGPEYLGYAIPNWRPLEKLQEINFGTIDEINYYLIFADVPCTAASDCAHLEGSWCNPNAGRCVDGRSSPQLCRGFPEASSPFPNTTGNVNVPGTGTRERPGFANAPKCEFSQGVNVNNREVIACGCNYEKVEYGRGNFRYYPEGTSEGEDEDSQYPEEFNGQERTGKFTVRGWQGFCLDEDTAPHSRIYNDPDRRACLTWWPIDQLRSAPDVANMVEEAGYQIPEEAGGEFWCLEGEGSTFVPLINTASAGEEAGRIGINQRVTTNDDGDQVRIRTFPVLSAGTFIRKDDIAAIEVHLQPPGEPGWGPDNYYLIPVGERTTSDQLVIGQSITQIVDGPIVSSGEWEAFDTTQDQEWWWWALDDNASSRSSPNPDLELHRAVRENLSDQSLGQVIEALKDITLNANEEDITRQCDGDILPWDDDGHNDYDAIATMLKFDDMERLTHIRLAFCSTGNDGGNPNWSTNDATGSIVSVNLYLRGQCNKVAQVDAGRSAPWTNRLWSGEPAPKWEVNHTPPGLNYLYNTQFAPFGSSSINTPPPTEGTGRAPWRMSERQDTFPGWPYMCMPSSLPDHGYNNLSGRCVGAQYINGLPCGLDPLDRPILVVSGNLTVDDTTSPYIIRYGISQEIVGASAFPFYQSWLNQLQSAAPREERAFRYDEIARDRGFVVVQTRLWHTYENLPISPTELCEAFGGECWWPADWLEQCGVDESFAVSGHGRQVFGTNILPLLGNEITWADLTGNNVHGQAGHFTNLFANLSTVYNWQGNADQSWIGQYAEDSDVADRRQAFRQRPSIVVVQVNAPEAIEVAGNLVSYGGFLNATVEFYAWANDNHMPLRQVAIDWDDGTQTITSGLYRNHSICDGQGFGRQLNVSCEERPFSYETIYICEQGVGPNWVDNCPVSGVRGGCCVFRPAVQVRDNWGYCNGNCGGDTSPGGTACLDDECNALWNPSTPGVGPWLSAPQTIYITAPQRVR